MSKGAGAIGSSSVRSRVASLVNSRGGVSQLVDASGMREESLAHWRNRFAGKSPAEVRQLAERDMKPVRVVIYREHGKTRAVLEDGRHRVTAAKEAGATKVRVEARVMGERGGLSSTWTGRLKL
jgi:hypothetical protein